MLVIKLISYALLVYVLVVLCAVLCLEEKQILSNIKGDTVFTNTVIGNKVFNNITKEHGIIAYIHKDSPYGIFVLYPTSVKAYSTKGIRIHETTQTLKEAQ